jgi:hypothetical protein
MSSWYIDLKASFRVFRLVITLTVLWYPTQGVAHRQHLSWSTIEWNAQANVLEITHRVHAHDASAWLSAKSNIDITITDIEQQAKFAHYCSKNFKLRNGRQWQMLELLGAELQGNYLLTYQQLSLDSPPTTLSYRVSILMDYFGDQDHVVNTILNGQTTTLSFDLQNTYQDVQF